MGLAGQISPMGRGADNAPDGLAHELYLLAEERKPDKRAELLHRIIDLYLTNGDDCAPPEQLLFDELLGKIVGQIQQRHRPEISRKLSGLPSLPDAAARPLALDRDIKVAGPVLRGPVEISEGVLLDAAKAGSQDHLYAIAGRSRVTPPVSDILVDRGDTHVVRTLAGNSGAQFSTDGMQRLIAKAEYDLVLQKLIIERPDLAQEASDQLMPFIIKGVAAAGGNDDVDNEAVRQYFDEWLRSRQINILEVKTCIKLVSEGKFALEDAVWQFVNAKRLLDAASVIAASIKLDGVYAVSVLTQGKPNSALMLIRSLELNWPLAYAFLTLRQKKLRHAPYDFEALEREYLAMDITTAQRVIRFLNVKHSVKQA